MAKQASRKIPEPRTVPSDPAAEVAYINEEFRVCCLSAKYYGYKLRVYKQAATGLDVVVALSATLAALPLFKEEFRWLLQWIAAVSAIAALLKSKLGFDKSVDRYTKLYLGYSELTEQFRRLCQKIKMHRGINESLSAKADDLFVRMDELVSLEDPRPNETLVSKLKSKVEREIPTTSLYWPECDPQHQTAARQQAMDAHTSESKAPVAPPERAAPR